MSARATTDEAVAAAFFAGFAALAHALAYRTGRASLGSIAFLPLLTGAALAPTALTVLATALAVSAGEVLQRREFLKASFNVAQHTLAVGLGILAYLLAGGESVLGRTPPVLAFSALLVSFMLVNKAAVAVVVALATRAPLLASLTRGLGSSLLYDLLSFPLVYVFSIAYAKFGAGWSAGIALPMLGVRQLYKTNFELEKINEDLLSLMVASIEARDPYTSGHSKRVARYSTIIARAAGFRSGRVERVTTAALLHDVGKIHEEFAPILRKPGRLTDSEYAVMKTHAAKGAELVARVSSFSDLVPPVRSHHEAWDGSGYPDGLRGDQIPEFARVIAIADTIDAMATSRPYRDAIDLDAVFAELQRQSARQFDPTFVRAVLAPRALSELRSAIAEETSSAPQRSSDLSEPPSAPRPRASAAVTAPV
ncbi:MAG: HD-GYP domain-containing protein [Gemmatimonadaceae bacterium]|nr:HD-GYP domain-containing protein [Gemmatimonadaceae bacterium]